MSYSTIDPQWLAPAVLDMGAVGVDPVPVMMAETLFGRGYVQKPVVEARLAELRALPDGWDGYRGRAVSAETSARVHLFLESALAGFAEAPSVVPGASGEVQLEWHAYGVDLEIGVDTSDTVSVCVTGPYSGDDGREFSFAMSEARPCHGSALP